MGIYGSHSAGSLSLKNSEMQTVTRRSFSLIGVLEFTTLLTAYYEIEEPCSSVPPLYVYTTC